MNFLRRLFSNLIKKAHQPSEQVMAIHPHGTRELFLEKPESYGVKMQVFIHSLGWTEDFIPSGKWRVDYIGEKPVLMIEGWCKTYSTNTYQSEEDLFIRYYAKVRRGEVQCCQ